MDELGEKEEFIFYGEFAFYRDEEERMDAMKFLILWLKFLKIKMDHLEYVDHSLIFRPEYENFSGQKCGMPTLAIKAWFKAKEV